MPKRILFLHRQPPSAETRETLDSALIAAVFDQAVSLLFREAGVQQLRADMPDRDLAEVIGSLPEYGLAGVYVCAEALAAARLTETDLIIPVKVLPVQAQRALLADQDAVLCD